MTSPVILVFVRLLHTVGLVLRAPPAPFAPLLDERPGCGVPSA